MPLKEDSELFQQLEAARAEFLVEVFTGTKVKYRPRFVTELLGGVAEQLGDMGTASAEAAATSPLTGAAREEVLQQARRLLCAFFDVEWSAFTDIIEELGSELVTAITEALADALPFLGTAISGGRTFKAWIDVALDAKRRFQVGRAASNALPGDASAAVNALKRIIDREITADTITASRLTGQTAVQATGDVLTIAEIGTAPVTFGGTAILAGPTALVGPAAALMSSMLGLVHHLFLLGRDYQERRAANRRLASPTTLDATVFEDCPLLGCYYITLADTSTVLNFNFADLAQPGFAQRIEHMRTKMEPVIVQASRVILKHRFELDGIDGQTERMITVISKGKVLRGDDPLTRLKRFKSRTKRQLKNAIAGPAKRKAEEWRQAPSTLLHPTL